MARNQYDIHSQLHCSAAEPTAAGRLPGGRARDTTQTRKLYSEQEGTETLRDALPQTKSIFALAMKVVKQLNDNDTSQNYIL